MEVIHAGPHSFLMIPLSVCSRLVDGVARVRENVRNSAQNREEFFRGLSESIGGAGRRKNGRRRSSAIRGISARLDREDEEELHDNVEGRIRYQQTPNKHGRDSLHSDLQVLREKKV